ncbi:class I SAM-dependent methyltransferase [Halobacteriales archaeon QS_8_65_32]|nr:MAG: class I SAM-dependent methyltransferase [Halobacteriales archaeon QS_8_65_32]
MNADDVHRQWAKRSGEFSPEYYAHRGPDRASEAIRALVERSVGTDGSVLELGCSSGRHLARLHAAGFRDLAGIELNADALTVMESTYPDLAASGRFHAAAIEDVVETVADDAFDAVYSVETLQHVHPESAWVFEELVRIADTLLITVENEGTVTGRRGAGGGRNDDADGHRLNRDDARMTYVDEGVPLYYRDWGRVFTDLGCTEVKAQVRRRDTLRAFRPPE